jgi:superfamily II DNA/RNA helicase
MTTEQMTSNNDNPLISEGLPVIETAVLTEEASLEAQEAPLNTPKTDAKKASGFDVFPLSPMIRPTLVGLGFDNPTPIQAATIPLALAGRDVLGSADTGTGKTLAYALPVVNKLLENPDATAIIITPTRELAEQVVNVLISLISKHRHLQCALLIGGMPIWKQFSRLQRNPCLIVGTPGRINDHLQRGSLNLTKASMLVIDEADRMLDMGFGVQLNAILEHMPKERQTLMFSATFPNNIKALSERFLRNPERVSMGTKNKPNVNLVQEVVFIQEEAKFNKLIAELAKRAGSVLVFASTKMKTERLAQRLSAEKVYAEAMHGDLRQSQRQRVLAAFREQKFRILVATDVAGRGLDVPHIEHVINYDMPQSPEDYIHRIGRTARNGAAGFSFCMVSRQDQSKWDAIQRLKQGNEYASQGGNGGGRGRQGGGGRGGFGGGRSAGRGGFGGGRSEGRSSEGRGGFGGGRSEGRSSEGRGGFGGGRSEGRSFEGRGGFGGGRSEGRPEGRSFGGGRSEGRSFEGRGGFGGGRSEGRSEGRSFGASRPEGRSSEGRSPFGESRGGFGQAADGERRRSFAVRDGKPSSDPRGFSNRGAPAPKHGEGRRGARDASAGKPFRGGKPSYQGNKGGGTHGAHRRSSES